MYTCTILYGVYVCVIFTLNKCELVLVYVKRYETDWL